MSGRLTGILGLYVGRIYDEAKRRPLYLVDRAHDPVGQDTPGQHQA